ncbi:MAG: carboxymuconolactone decarboxylase family protein [Hyphomicrobiales bacterium]|nr:carboxymuconolactone decarboxylase family protein [Hyphomicrobiales bacterium]
MAIVPLIDDETANDDVRAVYDDIRKTRKTDFVNNFWRALANDSALLARTWNDIKEIMGPGSLDPLVKEMIYVAVSVTNNCEYCIHSHTAAARAKGMTEEQLMELMSVVGMANETNRLANGLQIPVDDAFKR